MIKLERFEVMNFENAMRGARNPLNSWARMDSKTENEHLESTRRFSEKALQGWFRP